MEMKLSQLVAKVPNNHVRIMNIDLSLWHQAGLVLIECSLLVGPDADKQELAALQIPVQLSQKELLDLFSVTKVNAPLRRRKK